MKIASIVDNDSVNSLTGFTLSIYFQGCTHKCKGCFSKSTWNWKNGKEYSMEEIKSIILSSKCKNISILGGDCFMEKNRQDAIYIIEWIKNNTNKNLYVWTGYSKEEVENWIDISLIDFLITDRFEVENRNLMILLRGSTNQRIFVRGIQKTDDEILKFMEEM